MGKASSNKKVARAAKAAGRPGAKKSYAWPMAIGGVVLVGIVLVAMSFGGNGDNSAPRVGDHWHAAYGVYYCDHYVPPFPQEAQDLLGIHTHGEGLMHIHPFSSAVSGKKANIEAFANDVNLKLSDTAFEAPSLGLDVKNGDKCLGSGKPGHVELVTWAATDAKPVVLTKDIAAYQPQDQSIWTLAFVADDTPAPPLPESTINLTDPTAAENGQLPPSQQTSTTTPPAATSTPTTAKP